MHFGNLLASSFSNSGPRGAAPEMIILKLDTSYLSTFGSRAKCSAIGGTSMRKVTLYFST